MDWQSCGSNLICTDVICVICGINDWSRTIGHLPCHLFLCTSEDGEGRSRIAVYHVRNATIYIMFFLRPSALLSDETTSAELQDTLSSSQAATTTGNPKANQHQSTNQTSFSTTPSKSPTTVSQTIKSKAYTQETTYIGDSTANQHQSTHQTSFPTTHSKSHTTASQTMKSKAYTQETTYIGDPKANQYQSTHQTSFPTTPSKSPTTASQKTKSEGPSQETSSEIQTGSRQSDTTTKVAGHASLESSTSIHKVTKNSTTTTTEEINSFKRVPGKIFEIKTEDWC